MFRTTVPHLHFVAFLLLGGAVASNGKEVRAFEGHGTGITGVVFSADGKRVLTCGAGTDHTVRLRDAASGKELGYWARRHRAVPSAVEKALPLLLKGAEGHVAKRTCFACHNQALPILAFATAR